MNNESNLYRIKDTHEYTYTSKGSKFIAYAKPVISVAAAEEYVASLRQQHFKARHHCYAYRIGKYYRANDDGEPSGTAGLPIYNQILSFALSEIVVVVVRYFGGTLLGVPGLIKAYKEASHGALYDASREVIVPMSILNVQVDYPSVNALMRIIKQRKLTIVAQKMAMQCVYQLQCPGADLNAIKQEMMTVPSLIFLANN
ncbi:MAG: YigZ family protein [Cardiobacteriales bacterium]|nr:MAG: YigZ family protein [Cardiobacteriales bacterium]